MSGLALKHIVVHGENFLIIVGTGNGIGYLIQVYKFVDDNQHSFVAGPNQKGGKKLQKIIPGLISDNKIDAKVFFGFFSRGVFPTEPSENIGLQSIVVLFVCLPIEHNGSGKLKSIDHAFQRTRHGINLFFHQNIEVLPLGGRLGFHGSLYAGNPFFQDKWKSASVGFGLCG